MATPSMMRGLVFFLALGLMSGCSWFRASEKISDEEIREKEKIAMAAKTRADFYQELERIVAKRRKANLQAKKKQPRRLTRYVDKVWLGSKKDSRPPDSFAQGQQNLPDTITHQQEIAFISAMALDIRRVADRISEIIGIPVQVGSDNLAPVKLVEKARIRYRSGSLTGLLDVVAAGFDASWSYDQKSRSILLTRLETQAFDFYAPLDGMTQTGLAVLADPISAHAASSATQTKTNHAWQGMKQTLVNAIPPGSRVSLSPHAGKITITTTPAAMKQVRRLMHMRNQYFSRQIHLNVQVFELGIGRGERFLKQGKVDIPALLKSLGLAEQAPVEMSKTSLADQSPAAGKKTMMKAEAVKNPSVKLIGEDVIAILSALRKIGKLSVVTIADTRTRDGKIIPIRATSQQAYVSRTKIKSNAAAAAAAAAASADYQPATVMTGFSMNLRPRILPRQRVQVDMSASLRVLDDVRDFGSGNNRVRLPEISTNSWAQEVTIPSGTTLLVSGFEHDKKNIAADAKASSSASIIILITPSIVEMDYDQAG